MTVWFGYGLEALLIAGFCLWCSRTIRKAQAEVEALKTKNLGFVAAHDLAALNDPDYRQNPGKWIAEYFRKNEMV